MNVKHNARLPWHVAIVLCKVVGMTQEIMKWMQSTTDGQTVNAIAERSGLVGSTLSRQVKSGALTPETVVAVARAYHADPIEALLILGLITKDDVRRHGARALLESLSDRQLSDEVWSRLSRGSASSDLTDGQGFTA